MFFDNYSIVTLIQYTAIITNLLQLMKAKHNSITTENNCYSNCFTITTIVIVIITIATVLL